MCVVVVVDLINVGFTEVVPTYMCVYMLALYIKPLRKA